MVDEPGASARTVPLRKIIKKRIRNSLKNLYRSESGTRILGAMIHALLKGVYAAQRSAAGSTDHEAVLKQNHPAIVGLWHGQHLLAPFFCPPDVPFVALLSRNADAALNADVVERFGIATVRGSGGREGASGQKGGARALIALRAYLTRGRGVCMIADIPKGTPREAGFGIVTLARISGRPILPAAAVTSRAIVVEKSWDRTRVPLPFGTVAVVLGDPIYVPAEADAETMAAKRREVTRAIEEANLEAERLAGARR